jgi:hypothetical protein
VAVSASVCCEEEEKSQRMRSKRTLDDGTDMKIRKRDKREAI